MKNTHSNSGFSTIELLIAFGVVLIVIPPLLVLAFGGQSSVLDVTVSNGGIARVATQIRDAVASTTGNWNAIPISWDYQESVTETWKDDLYVPKPVQVSDISQCMKMISASTSWSGDLSRPFYAEATTFVPNIPHALAMGGTCDPLPGSEWDNPHDPDWKTSPSEIDGEQTGIDYISINNTPYIIMTTKNSSASQKDDVWIIDVSDTNNPEVVSSLDTGGVVNTKGLNDVVVARTSSGVFAYVVQNNDFDQLQTVDISDPDNPTLESTVSFEPYGVLRRPSGSDPEGRVITYFNGRLYAGLKTTDGPELIVFDVTANPSVPSFIGSIAFGFNHTINDIVIKDNYAFLATAPGNGANSTKELMVIDISTANPTDTGFGFNANLVNNDTEDATTLFLVGNTLYMGRERVANASKRNLYVFDVTDPRAPSVIKSKRIVISTSNTYGPPRIIDVVVKGKIGFVITTDPAQTFSVYDVKSNPNDIVPVSTCVNTVNLPKALEVVVKGVYAYVANGNQAALNILEDQTSACIPSP